MFYKFGWLSGGAVACASLTMGAGCGGMAFWESEESAEPAEVASAPVSLVDERGHEFVRVDQWDPAELQRVFEDSVLEDGEPLTAETFAAQLRGQMVAHDAVYIEAEAPLEMARQILEERDLPPPPAVEEVPPQVGRWIYGYDNRTYISGSGTRRFAFSERGCSATAIGMDSAVTAAHCVFNSINTNAYYCDNSSSGSQGGTSDNHNELPQGNACGARRYARWRFGVDGMNGTSDWMGPSDCLRIVIPTGFITNLDSTHFAPNASSARQHLVARWDYAALDFSQCANFDPSPVATPAQFSDTQIVTATGISFGYPLKAGCENAITSPGGGAECPNVAPAGKNYWQYFTPQGQQITRSTEGFNPPYGGARQFRTVDTDFEPGTTESGKTIRAVFNTLANFGSDTSSGNSGGALMGNDNLTLIGIASTGGSSINLWHRWDFETDTFIARHTLYPED
jgi:hypothetical protein